MCCVPINRRWARRELWAIAAVGLGGLLTAASHAGTINWAAAVSGNYQTASRWTGGVVPNTLSDTAQFNVDGAYAVTYTAAVTSLGLNAYDGDITLNLGGFKHSLGNSSTGGIGCVSGVGNPSLTITNGTVKMELTSTGSPGVVIGDNQTGATGRLVVSTGGIVDMGNRGRLFVGAGLGTGTVEVINGGKIYGNNAFYFGYALGAGADNTSTVTVSGKGSAIDFWSGLNLGIYDHQNVVLNISNGGKVAAWSNAIGKNSPAATSTTMTISGKDGDGVGSQWRLRSNDNNIRASGTVNINNGGILTTDSTSAYTLTVQAGGTLNLGGDSTVSTKGLVTVNGNMNVSHLKNQFVSTALTMGTGSDLNITLAADDANKTDAYLNVGTLTLSANGIHVSFAANYMPVVGDTFDLLNWTTLNGGPLTTANVQLPTLVSGLAWDTSLLESAGIITVAPAPGTTGQLAVNNNAVVRIYYKAPASGTPTWEESLLASVANDLKDKLNAMIGKNAGDPGAFTVATLAPDASTAYGIVIGKGTDFTDASWTFRGTYFDPYVPSRRDEYSVHVHSGGVQIGGGTAVAAQYAAWDVLFWLGYRQYFPTSTWETIPSFSNIAITNDWRTTPDFIQREFAQGYGTWSDMAYLFPQWKARNRLGSSVSINNSHAYGAIIARNQAQFDAHPEYYALEDGLRGYSNKLCLGNPALRQLIVNDALAQFAANPGLDSYSVEPSDGGGWCECPLCAALGSISDQQVTLANQVAAAVDAVYPGKKYIGMYAYNYHSPPPTISVNPRVAVGIATAYITGGYSIDQLLDGWRAKGATIGIRDYLSVMPWDHDLPGQSTASNIGAVATAISDYYAKGAIFYKTEMGESFGPNGLGYYMASRYLWDTAATASATWLRNDFLNRCFGTGTTARAKMNEFYAMIDGSQRPLMSTDLIGRMYGKLNDALNATPASNPTNIAIRKRLEDLAVYARYVELYYIYSAASGTDRQAAFEQLLRHSYKSRWTMMTHSYALWRDLDPRDPSVSIPDPNPSNSVAAWAENPHPWKDETPYTEAEILAFISNGIANNPLLDFVPVSFSQDLVPATPLGLTSGFGSYNYLRNFNHAYTWSDGTPHTFNMNVKGGVVYTTLGDVYVNLFQSPRPDDTPRDSQQVSVPNSNYTAVALDTTHSGLHEIDFWDNGQGFYVWPQAGCSYFTFPMTLDKHTNFCSRWSMCFYVPKGTAKIGGYSWGGAYDGTDTLRDSTGTVRYTFTNSPGYFSTDVPAGQDGKIWTFQSALGQRALLTVPPYVARSVGELLIPREVVDRDKP